MARGRANKYSQRELAWIEEHKEFTRSDLHRYFQMFFNRPEVTVDHLKALCTRKGWKTGRDGRLKPGNVPPNKGRRGYCAPGSEKGWFKKGQAPVTMKGPGHEYVDNKDGYVHLIVAGPHPTLPNVKRCHPVLKHRYLWEQAHGPIPAKHVLKCLDGDKTNCDPANWTLIPQGMLPFLNGHRGQHYDSAPPELRAPILAAARLKYEIRARAGKVVGGKRKAETALRGTA